MVVVAEGLPFDEKSLSLACPNPYLRECLIQSKPRRVYRRNNVVVVAGLANICARILEPVDDNAAPKAVLFSQQASASQLYHAVSHLYEEYSSPDAFNLVLVYNDKKYPLKFENKPLPELNLKSIQGVQYADLGLNRASLNGDHPDKSLELNHKSPKDDNSSLNYKIIDVAPRDESSPLCWSFLISPTTTLRELDDNMLFLSARSPSQTQVHLNYQKTGLDTTAETQFVGPLENLNLTFRELNYDFPHPNHTMSIVLPIERIDESENKPRVNLEEHQFLQEIFPTTSDFIGPITEFKSAIKYKQEVEAKPEMTYVGLVNQAMTCYLNSLLQALYMTPEFRNALYNWEYSDGHDREKATHSIPFQLQKLFLNLQTSNKAAVETTSLTKSFGWDSTEAWQQHDIQELCRVMFEALEQKFKNTQQADLINRLYEGKMIDYVKCLECRTEKTREDTFLDIPLPVKPFGSNVAYNSVEEALRAFVQPETLDDVNQYFCENCNKKCDAHKGLKFTKFPYLLTLHLKRFDFDYNTFHRVKLNDKVTFPDVLNLNSFIPSDDQESPTAEEDAGVGVKCDDGSTTDSGNLDECPVTNGIHSEPNTELNNHEQDDDEGIDVSNGPSTSSTEQEHDNRRTGPYMYELFAIMIHSGSASGGHYYAYIKDLRTNEWLCFNDQNVTPITNDDIEKTYGGGPTRGYYSGAYSSSTNAYMLMYRQIDPQRNRPAMEVNDFPKHIKELLVKMKEEEEERRIERPSHMYKIKVYVHHPTEKVVKSRKIFSVYDETLTELLEKTYKTFDLDGVVDLNQCRLVTYDAQSDTIDSTFDGYENDTLETLLQSSDPDMLLEIRKKDEPFEKYLPGGIGTKVFILDCVKKEVVDGPIYVRAVRQQRIKDYKEAVAKATGLKSEHMAVVRSISRAKILADNEIIDSALIPSGNRVFVASTENLTDEKEIENNLLEVLANFDSFIALDVELPEVTQEILEELNIQSLESKQRQKEQKEQQQSEDNQKAKADGGETSSHKDENWYPICRSKETDESVEQSNSEDSSLSDSDRTLVGDASEDEELAPATTFDEWPGQNKRDRWENDPDYPEPDYYFKAIPYKKDDKRHLRVIVDRQMRFAVFRKHLEPFVGVPVESFKVIRHAADACDVDYTRLSTPLRTICYDGDNISIKLGRALRPNEFRVKVYYLNIKNTSDLPWTPLFEWTVSRDATVATVKKQLLDELKRKNIPSLAELTFEKCRLRKKNFQIPSKVLLNDQKIRDCGIQTQCELILQELDEEDPVTNSDHVVVMVNRIRHNGGWVTGPINEIVLEDTYGASHKELADKLSQLSGIELEHLQISKGKWFGDYGVNAGMKQWLKASEGPWHCITLEDGASIFYRDSREKWVTENHDEMLLRQSDTENKRRYGSDRRERALKIYLDNK